jgi:FHS family Na+ dependent glucose MFS transporter 1
MPGKRSEHWPTTVGYFAVFVAVGLETAALGPTLPGLAKQTQTQLDAISFLFTGHALGYMLGSFLGGRLYDRVPGHPLMVSMLVLMTAMLALMPFISVLWLLAVVWLVLGMAGGALDVGGNTLLVWLHGRGVGPFMNALHFFFGVGSFLAPLIVAQALSLRGDVSGAYWVLALLVLPVAIWLARLRSPSFRANPAYHVGDHPPGGCEERSNADEGGKRRVVVMIALLLMLYVGAEAAFGGWIYTYAVALDVSDETAAAYLTSAFWGALTVGRLLSVPIAVRYQPRAILLADLAGCMVSVVILLLGTGSSAAVWVGTLGLGLAMASIFPTAISLAERRIPITGEVTGWFLVASSVGAMSLPWLIGQLFEPVGPQITMIVLTVDVVAAIIVLGALLKVDSEPVALDRHQGT